MKIPRPSLGSFRGWHIWLSIALSLPILIVGLTAVFIAHDKALELKSMQISPAWSPANQVGGKVARTDTELRAVWADGLGTQWLGSKMGLYRADSVRHVTEIDGPSEVRGLLGAGSDVLVAAKNGLWRVQGDHAQRLSRGDYWSVAALPQGLLAVPKEGDAQLSTDGGSTWDAAPAVAAATELLANRMAVQAASGEQTITVSKLVMDLHTGKAFLGKQYEWIWIDVVGGAMALLTMTGLVMWWRSQRRKVAQLRAQVRAQLDAHSAGDGTASPSRVPQTS